MPDQYSIKDLPDTSALVDDRLYFVPGSLLKIHQAVLKQLWRGENVNKGPNIYLRQFGDGGYSIASTAQPLVTGGAAANTPFKIFASKHYVSGTWDGTYDVTLWPGNVNGTVPTNMFSVINQAITSTQYVVLTCSSDGYVITSSSWSLTDTPPTQPESVADMPPSTFYVVLGVIFYNSDTTAITIYQIIYNNISAWPVEWTRTSRPDPGPFGLAYMIYYNWQLS